MVPKVLRRSCRWPRVRSRAKSLRVCEVTGGIGASLEGKAVLDAVLYDTPRRVWVDDGHVYIEGHDGALLVMTPEVAIALGRKLENAGTESFINKVMDGDAVPSDLPRA
jgi:hypothetical protein